MCEGADPHQRRLGHCGRSIREVLSRTTGSALDGLAGGAGRHGADLFRRAAGPHQSEPRAVTAHGPPTGRRGWAGTSLSQFVQEHRCPQHRNRAGVRRGFVDPAGLSPRRRARASSIQTDEAEGAAATEAPRGLLYHRYGIDENGLVTAANIVPPTSQNQSQIEDDLRDYLPAVVSTARRAGGARLRAAGAIVRSLHQLLDALSQGHVGARLMSGFSIAAGRHRQSARRRPRGMGRLCGRSAKLLGGRLSAVRCLRTPADLLDWLDGIDTLDVCDAVVERRGCGVGLLLAVAGAEIERARISAAATTCRCRRCLALAGATWPLAAQVRIWGVGIRARWRLGSLSSAAAAAVPESWTKFVECSCHA